MQQHYAGLDLASRIERLARVTMMVCSGWGAGAVLEIMFYDGWRWGLVLQRRLVRSSGVLSREGCRRGSRDLSPLCN